MLGNRRRLSTGSIISEGGCSGSAVNRPSPPLPPPRGRTTAQGHWPPSASSSSSSPQALPHPPPAALPCLCGGGVGVSASQRTHRVARRCTTGFEVLLKSLALEPLALLPLLSGFGLLGAIFGHRLLDLPELVRHTLGKLCTLLLKLLCSVPACGNEEGTAMGITQQLTAP